MSDEKLWQRPDYVTIPTVWARYESPKPMKNGVRPKFRIQDFSEEWRDQVLNNMRKFFLRDEPLSNSLGFADDQPAADGFISFVGKYLDRKMGLIAVVENLDDLGDESLPALAGCNITGVVTEDEHDDMPEMEKIKIICEALEKLKEKENPFKFYKVSEMLYAMGLSVDPAFRGHNLGYEILKSRFPLCKAVGIKVTVTVFTGSAAQKAATRLGFETLTEIAYDEYKDGNGQVVFKIDSPKSMKLMGIRIPENW
ncbi:hypothetical protein RUM43_008252 [Polyplax serrata]|uniref:N-acetyltransferase domain-containing protein n=1 Tax=Polyplax serrata TaxID=468196 RepID=A0AAN8S608_POLSC